MSYTAKFHGILKIFIHLRSIISCWLCYIYNLTEIKFRPIFFMKKKLQVFWVQWYDFLSQNSKNYYKYLHSMDKSMCQWINQSSKKLICKYSETLWVKSSGKNFKSKTHAFLLSYVYSKLNLNFSTTVQGM
jgi:hypothetical protein